MRDNISMIIATIIGVLLIVILPLISILERQDNTTYNIALTLTTEFVDEIREKGFIDKKAYDQYMENMSKTNCLFSYDIELHKRIIIPAVDDAGNEIAGKYVEDMIIENQEDLENSFNNIISIDSAEKNNVYLLEEGEEIYIGVKNTNTTSSSLMYRFIAGESDTTVVDIKYGGKIGSSNWKLYDNSIQNIRPNIDISIPLNKNNKNNVQIDEILETGGTLVGKTYKYVYKVGDVPMASEVDNVITYNVRLTNFGAFLTETGDQLSELRVSDLKKKIDVYECTANVVILDEDGNVLNDVDVVASNSRDVNNFKVRLENIMTTSIHSAIGFTIKANLGINKGYVSASTDSEEIIYMSQYDIHSVELLGPFNSVSREQMTNMYIDFDSYFLLKFTSIEVSDTSLLIEGIKNNFKIRFDGSDIDSSKYILDEGNINVIYDDILNFGSIEIPVKYTDYPSSDWSPTTRKSESKQLRNSVYLADDWVYGAQDWGVPVTAKGINKYPDTGYGVYKDDMAPSANISVTVDHEGSEILVTPASGIYIIPDNKLNIKISDLKDDADTNGDGAGIGCEMIGIRKEGASIEWSDCKGNITIKDFEVNFPTGSHETSIYVSFRDYMGNTSSEKQLKIRKDNGDIDFELEAKTTSGIVADENTWYNENIELTAKVKNRSSGYRTKITNINNGSTTGEKTDSPASMTIDQEGKIKVKAEASLTSVYYASINSIIENEYWIDKTSPTLTPAPHNVADTWRKKYDITFTTTDSSSGIKEVKYCLKTSGTPSNSEYIGGVSINSLGQFNLKDLAGFQTSGEYTLYLKAIDQAFNETIKSYAVKIDQTAPTVTWKRDPSNSQNIIITIKDEHSGIKDQVFSYKNKNNTYYSTKTLSGPDNDSQDITIENVTYEYLQYSIEDKLGNKSEGTLEIFENPEVEIINNKGKLTTISGSTNAIKNTTIRYSSSDDINSLSEYSFGRFGVLNYKIKNISSNSQLYLFTTVNSDYFINAGGEVNKTLVDEQIRQGMCLTVDSESIGSTERMGRITIKYVTYWEYYLHFVIVQTNGQYKIKTIKIKASNSPRIASVVTTRVDCGAWGCNDISEQSNEFLVWNSANEVDIENGKTWVAYNNTFILDKVIIAKGDYTGTIKLQYLDKGVLSDTWKDLATTSSSVGEWIILTLTEEKKRPEGTQIRITNDSAVRTIFDTITIN